MPINIIIGIIEINKKTILFLNKYWFITRKKDKTKTSFTNMERTKINVSSNGFSKLDSRSSMQTIEGISNINSGKVLKIAGKEMISKEIQTEYLIVYFLNKELLMIKIKNTKIKFNQIVVFWIGILVVDPNQKLEKSLTIAG